MTAPRNVGPYDASTSQNGARALSRRGAALLAGSLLLGAAAAYALLPGLRAEVHAAALLAARADIAPLRDYILTFGWGAPVISVALQLLTSIIAPLPSFVVAFVNALLFGFWWGALLTWTSALLAAAICFALARTLGRPVVERLVPRHAMEGTDRFFRRHGVLAVLVARLIPFVNPDVLSYAAGFTAMRWRLFLASIAVGSLPSTMLYSWLGSRGITQVGWLLAPLVLLGLLTLAGALLRRTAAPQP
jgi:uncharacterized membrane protein YdjX (TVP38/TMEM64 family)